ncbi:DUF3626 domain-containing protein [Streptomyces sp. NPDC088560]|uniref:DUF3626 domain-containing protein n=1 Tax=Streptomyces sp. NPDC088560 TaxID=3365868 RepID=UPI003816A09F
MANGFSRISAGQALARDGASHSQYVTGTSDGGLTAHPGGAHAGRAGSSGVRTTTRPRRSARCTAPWTSAGRWSARPPRFGSSRLRLTGAVLRRATVCYPDSAAEPTDFGVAAAMPLIALVERDEQDPLNDYVESHAHAGVLLDTDVEALVLDAGYRGTEVETAARRLPCPVEWRPGHRLTVTALPRHADYRGPRYADLGAPIAERGLLTPRVIGDAVRTGRHELQHLKTVWHTLARFGAPEGAGTARAPAGQARPTPSAPGAATPPA